MSPRRVGHLTVVGAGGCVGARLLELATRQQRDVTAVDRHRRTAALGSYGASTCISFDDLLSQLSRRRSRHGHENAGATKQAVHWLIYQAAGGHIDLYGAGNWRPFLHPDAAVTSILSAADNPNLTGVFNVAHDHATFGDVAEHAAAVFNADIVPLDTPDPRTYKVDTTRAEDAGMLSPSPPNIGLWASMAAYAATLQTQGHAHAS